MNTPVTPGDRSERTPRRGYGAVGVVSALLALAGCTTVGPDFKPPATPVPAHWRGVEVESPASTPTAGAAELATWWHEFKDPELDALVARASAANLSVRQAESRLRQSRAQYGVVFAGLWPSANASGSYRRTLATRQPRATDLYQAGFDATWELDLFGGTRRAMEAAQADTAAALEERRGALVTLAAEVAVDYIGLRGVQQQIVVAQENLLAQQRSAEIARKRFDGGFSSRLDLANAEAQVATTRAGIPELESQAQQTLYALALLLGQEPSALVDELSGQAPLPLTPPVVPVGLPADLLKRRPDVRQAEAGLHAATARIGVAKADLFPKITLTGAGAVSHDQLAALVRWDNRSYSLGPVVTWPILDAGKVRAGIRVQDELTEQALLGYQQAVLTALGDVESALVAYVKEQQRRQALADAVAANRQAVDLSTQLYASGEVEFINVIAAQRSLLATQDALIQSERAVASDLVAIYKALGGGWQTEPQTPAAPPPG